VLDYSEDGASGALALGDARTVRVGIVSRPTLPRAIPARGPRLVALAGGGTGAWRSIGW